MIYEEYVKFADENNCLRLAENLIVTYENKHGLLSERLLNKIFGKY